MARVELRGVKKVFPGGVEAVKGVDIVVEDREFLVLVGPSGCGKSTTLRMVAGLEEISAGEIHIDGRKVNDIAPKDRDIAMVFQNYALYPHMTVYQNMEFGLKLRRYPRAEREQRVRAAAETLGIEHLLNRRPKALSGGQRQRVAVGRAIVRQPKVFLFDEPLSNLDAKLRVQMRAEISKLHQRLQSTMIYVTHDQVEAMTMGDRIVVMHEGLIQQVDTPLNLYYKPSNKFVAGFIGSPAMNLLEVKLAAEEGRLRVRDASGTLDLAVPPVWGPRLEKLAGREVTLGLRPEDLVESPSQQMTPGRSIVAPLEVVEPMGGEANLYLTVGTQPLVARLKLDHAPREQGDYVIDVDMNKAHFFDAQTERTLAE